MNRVCSIFSQLLQLFPRLEFEHAVRETRAERHARGFTCWGQFVAMLFCHLAVLARILYGRRAVRLLGAGRQQQGHVFSYLHRARVRSHPLRPSARGSRSSGSRLVADVSQWAVRRSAGQCCGLCAAVLYSGAAAAAGGVTHIVRWSWG